MTRRTCDPTKQERLMTNPDDAALDDAQFEARAALDAALDAARDARHRADDS